MKKVFKNIVIIIAVIMILLSSCIPNTVLAESETPDYNGLPEGGEFGAITFTDWIVNSLKDIFDWFIGIITYIIKAVFLGWAGILEKAVTGIVGIGTATDIEGSLTVEKIVTNKVPILDVNFFSFYEAGGRELNSNSIIYMIRSSIAQFYYIIRNVTIAGMLITLIYIGIRIALSSIAESRAKYKSMLIGWVESMVLVFFIHYIMVFIIQANQWFITVIQSSLGGAEETLYDTIRSQSYAIQASIGWPATIIYICLLYLLVKFLYIYLRRFANIAILTFLAPVIAISFAIDKIKDGKSQSFSKWLKDYTINVLTQAVHCLLYFLFIKLAFDVAGQSIYGVVLALFFISCISKGEKVFKTIFGMESESGMAPLGGLHDNSWRNMLAKAKLFKGAARVNAKIVGGATKIATKPLRFGAGLARGFVRDNRIARIQQSIYMARVTGSNSVNIRGQEYDVGQLIETGQELGYSDRELAQLFHAQLEEDKSENIGLIKEGVKGGLKNAGAFLGMATSIPLIAEDPITAYERFNNYRKKFKIKGYKRNLENYTGSNKETIKNAIKHHVAVAGIASSIPAMAINPLAGAAILVASTKMRKTSIYGYNNQTVKYKAKKGTKRKIKNAKIHRVGIAGTVASAPLFIANPIIGVAAFVTSSAIRKVSLEKPSRMQVKYTAVKGTRGDIAQMGVDFVNFNTLNVVPMIHQIRANVTENQYREITQNVTYQYRLSNQILQKQIDEAYQKLLNDPNVDKDELERIIKEAQSRIVIEGIPGTLERYVKPKEIELKSYKDLATIDMKATAARRKKDKSADVTVIEPNDGVDAVDFTAIVMDYAESGERIISEYDGVSIDSDKYSDGLELYKEIVTQGGAKDEEEVLKELNEQNGTDYETLDEMFREISKEKEQKNEENGERYIIGLDKLNDKEKKDIIDKNLEERERKYVERIIEAVSMKASDEIDNEGLTEEVIDLMKKKISISSGKDADRVSMQEVSKQMAAMSKEEIVDVMEVAVTKNSVLIKGKTPKEFRELLTLMDKKKYNDYAISQISYDRTQATSVSEKIKANRGKGVK